MKKILQEIYENKKNSRFRQQLTLREFSRFLGINVATLSRVFSDKEKLSVTQAEKILANPGVEEQFKSRIVAIYFPSSKNPSSPAAPAKTTFHQDEKDGVFDFTWIDLAVLELFNIEKLDQSYPHLAHILSVSANQIIHSVEKLERHDLIEMIKDRYHKRDRNLILGSLDEESTRNLREFHKELAIRGTQELKKTSPSDVKGRLINSYVIATHSEKIPEAARRIEAFQKELMDFLTEGEANEVYALSSQFFSLGKAVRLASEFNKKGRP